MNESKPRPTSLDYALAGLAPAFIILMIGSLVAFLMTALYQGEFPIRLMWVLGLYTFASVLISRIAIEQSRSQAFVYLLLLAGATLFVAPRHFVIEGSLASLSFPILVVFLILITYLADRITFDCTNIDDAGEAHGEGLMQSLGLLKKSRNVTKANAPKRKHNPGVWILYFAILAVPVFGLGQLVIASSAGRRLAWIYMIVYMTSALLLLVMISLLSVRRYTRQRNLEMDAGLSMKWLAAGGTAIVLLMMVMSILPLPALDGGLWEPPFKLTSRDNLQSHRWGWGNEATGDGNVGQQQGGQQQGGQQQGGQQQGGQQQAGQQQAGQQQAGQQQAGQQQAGQQAGQQQAGQQQAGQQQGGQQQGGQQQGGQQQGGQQQGGQQQGGQQQGGQQQGGQQQGGQQQGGQQQGGHQQGGHQQGGQQQAGQQQAGQQQGGQQQGGQQQMSRKQPDSQQRQEQRAAAAARPQSEKPASTTPSLPKIEWNPGASLRWLMVLTLLAIATFFAIRHRRDVAVWARDFLAMVRSWFVRDAAIASADQMVAAENSQEAPIRFSDLPDPFSTYAGDPDRAVKALFDAACIWGREHRVQRREDETPEEFVARLSRKYSPIAEGLTQLGMVYSRLAYAQKHVHPADVQALRPLWDWMAQHPSRHGSPGVILNQVESTDFSP